jgi:hypothetical protein
MPHVTLDMSPDTAEFWGFGKWEAIRKAYNPNNSVSDGYVGA